MPKIPEKVVEEIVSQIDILSYLQSRGIEFRRQGTSHKTRCPFPDHDDSTPSFSVKPSEQYFHCFGCGEGGNVLNFIMNFDGIEFPQAVKVAADYAGYALEDEELFSPQEVQMFQEKELLKGIYLSAAEYCYKVMPIDIKEHLKNHYGFTEKYMEKRMPGYDDGHLYDHLYNTMGYSKEELLKSGLFYKYGNQPKDMFHTRIIFWYWKRGYPVYAIARETDYTKQLDGYEKYEQHAKYKKLATFQEASEHDDGRTFVSKAVKNDYIYNEDICLNSKERPSYIIITEGMTDAMLAEQKGIPVISPVTKTFKDDDHDKLKRLVKFIDSIYIVNDNEDNEEGLKGALDTAKVLNSDGKKVHITMLPRDDGQKKVDLNMFLQGKTRKEFESFLTNNSELYHDFLIDKAMEHKENDQEIEYWDTLKRALFEAKDMDPMPRELFFKNLSKKVGVKKRAVENQFKEVVKKEKQKPEHRESKDFTDDLMEKAKEQSDSKAEKLFKDLVDNKNAKFFRTSNNPDDNNVTMILNGKFYKIESADNAFTRFLMNEYKMNYIDHKVRKTIFEFKAKAYKHASKLKKQTWLYYDKYDEKMYFSIGYGSNYLLKITPDEISRVYNGEDDGIFVNEPDSLMEVWDFDPSIDNEEVAKELHDKMIKFMPVHKNDALLMLLATMVIPLKRLADTTPIIKVHGESSSGKTQVAKKIVNLFYGNEQAIGDMTDASKFDRASARPIIIFDNLENIKQGSLEQFLLYSASGGVREKRDRNSENGTIKQIVDALSILTAIHPFDKKELLNRSLDITADKKYHCYDKDVTIVNDEIRERRSEYLSLWVQLIQKSLGNKKKIKNKRNELNRIFHQHFKDRLNGYYSLMWEMAEHFLKLVGYSKAEVKSLVLDWVEGQSHKGALNEKDTSQIFSFFNTLATYIRHDKANDLMLSDYEKKNNGDVMFEATGQELLRAFTSIAKDIGAKFPYSNTKQLMARVNNDFDILQENNWEISLGIKKISGTNVHRFYHSMDSGDRTTPDWAESD